MAALVSLARPYGHGLLGGAMLLLVIGLVAVIVAVLVGFFLTRRRRDDDDEPGGRQPVRDRLGSRGRDGRLRTDPRMARKPAAPAPSRRPAGEPRGYGGPDRGYEPAGFDQSRGYEPSPRGYGERAPRSRDDQHTERIPAARRDGRYQDMPEPAGARAPRAASAPRRGAVGTDTGPGNALYDTGPSAADLTGTRISADPDLADSDTFPRVRAETPETEVKARPKNQSKGRGRPSRGRHDDDDDDWPSTEWDKLSDEQYWAELSADKPLATMARPAQPSAPAAAGAPAQPLRAATPPPASGRAAYRPQPAPDAEPDVPGRRQPADRPDRPAQTGSRQGTPRRADGADTDPGRPGLAELPAAAAATEQLPARRRPAAETAAPAPAPYLPAAPEAVQARVDDDPLTSPHFARGAGGADDSRSYRTPRRDPGPPQDRSGGQAYPSAPNGYPGTPNGYPSGAEAYPAGYPASSGSYPASGRNATGPLTNPGGPARSSGAARGRDSYAGQARESLAGGDGGDRRYTDPSGGYASYPGTPDGGQDYPVSSGRHGYPARQADRTDPGASRPDPGAPRTDPGASRSGPGPRTSPGRRRSASAAERLAPARQAPVSPPPSHAASTGYPASPAAPAPGWGSDRSAAAEAPSAQSGLGNPYGSYVEPTPPAAAPTPAPAARTAPAPSLPPASPYPPDQQAAGGNSYPGYTTGPAAAYSDPYGPGHGSGPGTGPGSYPANGRPPAADGRAEQGTTWYSAPPAAAPQAPSGAYPYQDSAYPAAAGYPNRGGYPGTPETGDDTRYRNGQTEDPYRPDGYSGYHSRQG
jgi:hypothetical protein